MREARRWVEALCIFAAFTLVYYTQKIYRCLRS